MTSDSEPAPDGPFDQFSQTVPIPPAHPHTGKKRPFWQFGFVEFYGMLLAIAVLWLVFLPRDGARGTALRANEVPGRMLGAVLACVIPGAGTYLSSRLATKFGIHQAWRRLILQMICTVFLLPPLLCVAAFALPAVAYNLAHRWGEPDATDK